MNEGVVMNRKNSNPFDVLGLSPEALNGLTDLQIDTLISGVSKTLQKIYHPDVSKSKKSVERSADISFALEQLNRQKYPEGYLNWKKTFMKKTPLKKRLSLANGELLKSVRLLHSAYIQSAGFLENKFFGDAAEVFAFGNKQLHIHHTWLSSQGFRWVSSENNSFFEYRTDEKGHVISVDGHCETFDNGKCIVGVIDGHYFLNILMREIRDIYEGLDKKRQIASVNARIHKGTKYRGPIITQDHFGLVIPHIKFADVTIGDYVVSINKTEEGSIFFQIDGSLKEVK